MSLADYFNTNVNNLRTLRVLAHPTNAAVSLEYRVRSYLAANCAQCHQPGGLAWAIRLSGWAWGTGLVESTTIGAVAPLPELCRHRVSPRPGVKNLFASIVCLAVRSVFSCKSV